MAIMINGFTITSLERIHGYDRVDKSCALLLTELQNTTLNATEETSDITGKGGRVLKQIKKNKGLTVNGASALISGFSMFSSLRRESSTRLLFSSAKNEQILSAMTSPIPSIAESVSLSAFLIASMSWSKNLHRIFAFDRPIPAIPRL